MKKIKWTEVKIRFKAIEDRLDKLEGKKPKEVKVDAEKHLDLAVEKDVRVLKDITLESVGLTKDVFNGQEITKVEEKPERVVTKTSDVKGKEIKGDKKKEYIHT